MRDSRSYGSPAAFRRALTDKLKVKSETSKWTLPQLQRQMAYDRLLERLYLVDDGSAVISPGGAATLTVTFKTAGTYEYLCTVSGHAAAGQKGVLKVT